MLCPENLDPQAIATTAGAVATAAGAIVADAVAGAAATAVAACTGTVACAVVAGAAGEIYAFGFSPNREKNRADLARGYDYVIHGGHGYVWVGSPPPLSTANTEPPPPFEVPPGITAQTPGRGENIFSFPGSDTGQSCPPSEGFDLFPKPEVFPLPFPLNPPQGPVIFAATPIRPATKFTPSDVPAFKQFAKEAGSRTDGMKSWSEVGWLTILELAKDPSYAQDLLVYRSGDRITGAVKVSESSQYPDALYMSILEALPGRAFAGIIKGAILESINRGFNGRLVGEPAGQALENYINAGAKPYKNATYLLDEEAAKEFLRRFP